MFRMHVETDAFRNFIEVSELFHPWSKSSPIDKASEEQSKTQNFIERLESNSIQKSLVCVDDHLIKGEYS